MIVDIRVPSPGESITEVQISRWLKADGDYVKREEELAEIDSDKATLTVTAEADGKLNILVKEGETVAVGTVIGSIETEAIAAEEEKPKVSVPGPDIASSAFPSSLSTAATSVQATPLAVRLMKENRIDPSQIQPSPGSKRITKSDVMKWMQKTAASGRGERREKMTMLRKKLSERLVAVRQQTAMLTTINEIDMQAVMDLRRKYKEAFKEKHGEGLGLMSFFTRAVCIALKTWPIVNARIEGDEIIYPDYCDIGIAVSAPRGLMVPVIRNAESLSLAEIEKQVRILATRVRENKITIEEMSGGTFTITNGGVFGSLLSTPLINPPQSAILGMHNIVERPVAIKGQVVIRPMMYVALSYDHRLIDGRESVGFLLQVKHLIENPLQLLLDGKDPERLLLDLE
jgi:2-oxoglutarate dehydrogenase E2 component (dihydrolipoamide succinyltransferase)